MTQPGNDWTIRPAQATDMPTIRALVSSVNGDEEELEEDQFLVAQDSYGLILGCGRLRPYQDFCELASLAVVEAARVLGVGRGIVEGLIQRFDGPVYLVCEDNVVGFFRRFGFKLNQPGDMPPGLMPKWQFYTGQTGHMNVMQRG